MTLTGTTPITYLTTSDYEGTETNVGDGGCTYNLYANESLVSNPDNTIYGIGHVNYTYNTSGCHNYTNGFLNEVLVINQNTGNCNILFNETSPLDVGQQFRVYTDCTSGYQIFRTGS